MDSPLGDGGGAPARGEGAIRRAGGAVPYRGPGPGPGLQGAGPVTFRRRARAGGGGERPVVVPYIIHAPGLWPPRHVSLRRPSRRPRRRPRAGRRPSSPGHPSGPRRPHPLALPSSSCSIPRQAWEGRTPTTHNREAPLVGAHPTLQPQPGPPRAKAGPSAPRRPRPTSNVSLLASRGVCERGVLGPAPSLGPRAARPPRLRSRAARTSHPHAPAGARARFRQAPDPRVGLWVRADRDGLATRGPGIRRAHSPAAALVAQPERRPPSRTGPKRPAPGRPGAPLPSSAPRASSLDLGSGRRALPRRTDTHRTDALTQGHGAETHAPPRGPGRKHMKDTRGTSDRSLYRAYDTRLWRIPIHLPPVPVPWVLVCPESVHTQITGPKLRAQITRPDPSLVHETSSPQPNPLAPPWARP